MEAVQSMKIDSLTKALSSLRKALLYLENAESIYNSNAGVQELLTLIDETETEIERLIDNQ